MNSDYMARELIARTYKVDKTAEPASEYLSSKNPANNYFDRLEQITEYSSMANSDLGDSKVTPKIRQERDYYKMTG